MPDYGWFAKVSGLSFLYMHLLVALITLVVFQMLGGITDFIAHGAVFGQRQNLPCCYKNWTLSVIFSAGLVAFNNDFDTQLKIWLAWYGLTSIRTGGLPFMYSHWGGLAA